MKHSVFFMIVGLALFTVAAASIHWLCVVWLWASLFFIAGLAMKEIEDEEKDK